MVCRSVLLMLLAMAELALLVVVADKRPVQAPSATDERCYAEPANGDLARRPMGTPTRSTPRLHVDFSGNKPCIWVYT
jgi:hypothetical protein